MVRADIKVERRGGDDDEKIGNHPTCLDYVYSNSKQTLGIDVAEKAFKLATTFHKLLLRTLHRAWSNSGWSSVSAWRITT